MALSSTLPALLLGCGVLALFAASCSSASGGGGSGGAGTSSTSSGADGGPCAVDCAGLEVPSCYEARCNPGTGRCEVAPTSGQACDDALFCTINDTCDHGVCKGVPNDCGLSAPDCKSIACDEKARTCSLAAEPDGLPCAAADLCLVSAACQGGACVGERKACTFAPVADECHVGVCNPSTGACDTQPGNNTLPCFADPCMVGQTCKDGTCVGGQPRQCSKWGDACNDGACDPQQGGCYRVPHAAGGVCGNGDPCNSGICDGAGSCVFTAVNDGAACSDGVSCTAGDTCSAGVCQGTPQQGYVVYFRESFASNAQGWLRTGPWEIGPSLKMFGGVCGDPQLDHTDSNENGVAGTIIGGAPGPFKHDHAYLESPAVDVASASNVTLEFFHRLSLPPPPWADARVEVFDGAGWVSVWANDLPVHDCAPDAWLAVKVDLTPYKNAQLRVRFGMASYVNGNYPGWTIDDVVIANQSCM